MVLLQQVLIRDKKLVFHLHAAAVQLGSGAEHAPYGIIFLPGARVHLAGAHRADEQVFRRIERRDILHDR